MRRIVPALVACCILTLSSCSTKSVLRFEKFSAVAGKGEFLSAVSDIKNQPKLYGKNNLFLYNMDIGMLYHYAGVYDSSTSYLLKASQVYDDLFTRSVSNEAASLLINDNVRPYRSKPYELVLLHQTLQYNYLAAGQPDEALVEGKAVQLLFNEWERKNAKDNHYFSDGMFHYITSMVYDELGQTDEAMISLYKSVEAYKQGPVALPPEVAAYAYQMLKKNNRTEDVEKLKLKPEGPALTGTRGFENDQSEIVVIGYAGRGPALVENQWWGDWISGGLLVLHHSKPGGEDETMAMPAPGLSEGEHGKADKGGKTSSGTTVFIKVALPAVRTFPSETDHFTVINNVDSRHMETITIDNLDQQAEKQREDAQASVVMRTVIRVVTRTIAAQEAKKKMETNSGLANLFINIATDVVSSQMEKADTRCCFFIPKTVQIARMPVVPGIYSITVQARDRGGAVIGSKTFASIDVKPHAKRFVFYSSLR